MITKRLEAFESNLVKFVDSLKIDNQSLLSACKYSLFGDAKRFRPQLCYQVGDLLNIDLNKIDDISLAIELIHTSSLIHDDLPALDNDDYRRGKLTCHKQYGEGIALLAGNILVSEAFHCISISKYYDAQHKTALIKLLSSTFTVLCDGQAIDIEYSNPKSKLQVTKESFYKKKTSELIKAALIAPCIIFDDNKRADYIQLFTEYGDYLGLLFQLTDDIIESTVIDKLLSDQADNVANQLQIIANNLPQAQYFRELPTAIRNRQK